MVAPHPRQGNYVSDLFQEVDEDLRRDRAAALWKRYGNYVIGAAIALVAASAGYSFWRDYSHRQAVAQGHQLYEAATLAARGERDQAMQGFENLARTGSTGYATLARLREADVKAKAGDSAAATAIYRGVADDSAAPTELRHAAAVLAGLHALEKLDAAELDRQLATLRADNNPWRFSAIELAALAAARAGDAAKARELYAKIADDPSAPAGLRARAAEMVAVLGS